MNLINLHLIWTFSCHSWPFVATLQVIKAFGNNLRPQAQAPQESTKFHQYNGLVEGKIYRKPWGKTDQILDNIGRSNDTITNIDASIECPFRRHTADRSCRMTVQGFDFSGISDRLCSCATLKLPKPHFVF